VIAPRISALSRSVFPGDVPHKQAMLSAAAALVALLLALVLATPAYAQEGEGTPGEPSAWILVETDAGRTFVRPMSATLPITGLAALQATGLDVAVAETSFGPAVCAIEGVGCPADDCFCNDAEYWNYSYWDGSAWVPYAVGASSAVITQTGAIEGWRWGGFEGGQALSPAEAESAQRALDWILAQQQADGGYGNMGGTIETLMAIGANGLTAGTWQSPDASRSLAIYSRYNQARFSRSDVAAPGKLAVALAAGNACISRGTVRPLARYSDETGAYGPSNAATIWGILGTLAMSETVPADAVATVFAAQDATGGWEWQADFGADSNTTSLAIQALIAAGEPMTSTAVVSGLAYLKSTQQADGGFAYDAVSGTGSDANSTAYVLQALAAAGEDPASEAWTVEGATPLTFMLGLQMEDGSFEWQPGTGGNLFATQQAVAALLRQPYPIAMRPLERCR